MNNIKKQIGRGSTCRCYRETQDDRTRIVKRLTLPEHLSRFTAAYALQQRLSKGRTAPYVVKPLDARLTAPPYWAAFEDDGGTTLDQVEFSSLREILLAVQEAARALHALHQKKLLYVDVKANNFLRCPNGQIKLFDFDSVLDLTDTKVGMRIYGPHNANLADPGIRICLNGQAEVSPTVEYHHLPFLTPKLDIYGLGAMLYALILDRNPCSLPLAQQQLRVLCSNRFRGEMTAAQQRQLCRIMEKATQQDPALRYASAAQLADSLKRLVKNMDAHRDSMLGGTKEDRLLTAAWVLNQYPLFRYQQNDQELTLLLAGDSPIRKEFLHLILACAQLPQAGKPGSYRPLNVHLMTDRPEDLHRELKACGNLLEYVSLEDRTAMQKKPAKQSEVKSALAHFVISSKKKLSTRLPDFSYAILLNEDPEENVSLARNLLQTLSKKPAADARAVLVGDLRTDGADPRKISIPKGLSKTTCCTFALNGIAAGEEITFRQQVERDAFTLHTYYAKEQNQRISQQELHHSFANYDQKLSSIRSVLSIPYKLHACGLDICRNPAKELCNWLDAYDQDPTGTHPQLQQLIHMEHRSWFCFTLLQGWCVPDEALLKAYAFTEKQPGHKLYAPSDQHRANYHACLADSTLGKELLPLSCFSQEDWDHKGNLQSLDPLDCRSVRMHRICADRVDAMIRDNRYQKAFDQLKQSIPPDNSSYRRACDLEIIGKKLLQGQTQTDALWNQILKDLTQQVQSNQAALQALEALQFPMRLVLERNAYRDYKRSDLDLIRAIPEILDPQPVSRIYKLFSNTDWCNVVSAVMTDAKELVLLYDPQTDDASSVLERQQVYQTFFRARIPQASDAEVLPRISCLPLDSKKVTAYGTLDITGAKPHVLHRALQYKRLQKLPVVHYEKGCLHGLTQEGPLWSVYNGHDRSLSVGETLLLGGNTDLSDRLENDLLSLHDTYRLLWEKALSVSAQDWNTATTFMFKYTSAEYPMNVPAKPKDDPREYNPKQAPMILNEAMLTKLGLMQVLDALKAQNILRDYKIVTLVDDAGKSRQKLEVTSCDSTCQENNQAQIDRLISYISLAPEMEHRYELREVPNHRKADEPAFVILDQYLGFDAPAAGSNEIAAMDKLTTALANGIIRKEPSAQKNKAKVFQFQFGSTAIRDCLLKSGNVLEVFAYHVISDSGLFDDVKPNVHIHWQDGNSGALRQTTNEVDLICTKGMRTYFISCKKTEKLDQSYYDQVWYQAHRLGVDAVPILLYAGVLGKGPNPHISRGARMGVETISLPTSSPRDGDSNAKQTVLDHEALLLRRLREILG